MSFPTNTNTIVYEVTVRLPQLFPFILMDKFSVEYRIKRASFVWIVWDTNIRKYSTCEQCDYIIAKVYRLFDIAEQKQIKHVWCDKKKNAAICWNIVCKNDVLRFIVAIQTCNILIELCIAKFWKLKINLSLITIELSDKQWHVQ